MVPANVIKILDFVDPNNPILACESFLKCVELRTLGWKTASPNTILGLAGWEEGVVIIV